MKQLAFALFVLWFLSLEFYLYVPGPVSVLLGIALVATTTVALSDWVARRSALRVGNSDSFGL